jgi:hypothetical protein
MDPVERDVYFIDVQLQMDAKLWGEEFNRHNPPKKVNFNRHVANALLEIQKKIRFKNGYLHDKIQKC